MKSQVVGLGLMVAVGLAGCSLFHHSETPQQKFIDALNRGHSAEASQIWLHMSAEDRNKFRLGQGIEPAAKPEEVMKMMTQMNVNPEQGPITIGPTGGTLRDLPQAIQQGNPAPPASGED